MKYADIVDSLSLRRPFAFARYGDGELLCMAGAKGANKDRHRFHGDLGEALQESVRKPKDKITYALQGLVRRDNKLKAVLARHSKVARWADSDVLHQESRHRSIESLFKALVDRKAKLVGPQHLSSLDFTYAHVLMPDRDCWLQHKTTLLAIKARHKPGDVWVLCASMSSVVIIYDLVDELEDVTFLDAGSLFEPYVGRVTRAYHKEVRKRLKR